jgi:hypothetical protein
MMTLEQGPEPTVPVALEPFARFDFHYYDHDIRLVSPVALKGIAYGGDRGVGRVEVSVEGVSSWREAKLEYPGTRLSWALWTYEWEPPGPGEYKLVVRATDGCGRPTTAEDRATVPQEVTGCHQVTVRFKA